MYMVRISQNNKLRVAYINTVTYLVTTIICHQYVQNFASFYHNSRHTVVLLIGPQNCDIDN
jgi:hypothetical protein